MNKLKIKYNNSFNGEMDNNRNEYLTKIGEKGLMPYELAMTGLVSCFYSTFVDIATKKRLEWEFVEVDFSWEKLDEAVAFLKEANINMTVTIVKGKEEHFDKAFELAAKYCSLFQTFSKVADVSWKAEYKQA